MNAREVFDGSDGGLTRRYTVQLSKCGPRGVVAVYLFRAQKASTRARQYHGGIVGIGSYRDLAYQKKNESIRELCAALERFAEDLLIPYGWKLDTNERFAPWVLYIELPQGQVSFHAMERGHGPEYTAELDGVHASRERILAFCDSIFDSIAQSAPSLFS